MSINLLPCPFCGHESPEFERMGDRRQSCIVICGWCGARHESSDEGDRCGSSWNQRAEPTPSAPTAVEPPAPSMSMFASVADFEAAKRQAAVEPDERAEFEAWYFDKYMLQPENFGDRYDCQIANQQWIAWQARASKGTP